MAAVSSFPSLPSVCVIQASSLSDHPCYPRTQAGKLCRPWLKRLLVRARTFRFALCLTPKGIHHVTQEKLLWIPLASCRTKFLSTKSPRGSNFMQQFKKGWLRSFKPTVASR
jgi:hypothetical protein